MDSDAEYRGHAAVGGLERSLRHSWGQKTQGKSHLPFLFTSQGSLFRAEKGSVGLISSDVIQLVLYPVHLQVPTRTEDRSHGA